MLPTRLDGRDLGADDERERRATRPRSRGQDAPPGERLAQDGRDAGERVAFRHERPAGIQNERRARTPGPRVPQTSAVRAPAGSARSNQPR
jgi:hypothetical protein